jgi:hypothetical protein
MKENLMAAHLAVSKAGQLVKKTATSMASELENLKANDLADEKEHTLADWMVCLKEKKQEKMWVD